MIQSLPRNAILSVQTINFMGSAEHVPLHDKYVWLNGDFIIVANDINDSAPTWYNVATVASMDGVEVVQAQRSNQMRLFTY